MVSGGSGARGEGGASWVEEVADRSIRRTRRDGGQETRTMLRTYKLSRQPIHYPTLLEAIQRNLLATLRQPLRP